MIDWLLVLYSLSFAPLAFFFAGCSCCNSCAVCDGGSSAHQQVQVDIAGILNGPCGAPCAGLNGTFILDFTGVDGSGRCTWGVAIPSICSGAFAYAELRLTAGRSIEFGFKASQGAGAGIQWIKTNPADTTITNCNWSSYQITNGTNIGSQCAFGSFPNPPTTCFVTAL